MPSNKFYLVDEDSVTSGLSDLDVNTTAKTMRLIEVEPDDISEADGIVANYNSDDFISDTSVQYLSGDLGGGGLKLPKKEES